MVSLEEKRTKSTKEIFPREEINISGTLLCYLSHSLAVQQKNPRIKETEKSTAFCRVDTGQNFIDQILGQIFLWSFFFKDSAVSCDLFLKAFQRLRNKTHTNNKRNSPQAPGEVINIIRDPPLLRSLFVVVRQMNDHIKACILLYYIENETRKKYFSSCRLLYI